MTQKRSELYALASEWWAEKEAGREPFAVQAKDDVEGWMTIVDPSFSAVYEWRRKPEPAVIYVPVHTLTGQIATHASSHKDNVLSEIQSFVYPHAWTVGKFIQADD